MSSSRYLIIAILFAWAMTISPALGHALSHSDARPWAVSPKHQTRQHTSPPAREASPKNNAIPIKTAGLFALGLLLLIIFRNKKHKTLHLGFVCLVGIAAANCTTTANLTNLTDTVSDTITSQIETMQAAFSRYTGVTTFYDANYFYVESNGLPEHNIMVGITTWNDQLPAPQHYIQENAWPIPLNTEYASTPMAIDSNNFRRGAIGIAVNGIPIFNPYNASGLISYDIGELDEFGGHTGRGDDYHYHISPRHLDNPSTPTILAYALDGYPIYGEIEPDGATMTARDSYAGHEYQGSYHYHYGQSDAAPYLVAFRGNVAVEGSAPETQVTPQPRSQSPRGEHPYSINATNLLITGSTKHQDGHGYTINYRDNNQSASVTYTWTDADVFTYTFHDVDPVRTVTQTFTRILR